jgi:hypothetical protein
VDEGEGMVDKLRRIQEEALDVETIEGCIAEASSQSVGGKADRRGLLSTVRF